MKLRPLPFLFLIATAFLVCRLLYPADVETEDEFYGPSYSWSEMREIFLRERELEQERKRAVVFREKLTSLKGELLDSALTLIDAAEALVTEARENNPKFLLCLRDRCANASLTTAAALVLVDHLLQEGCNNRLTEEQLALVDCLRSELEQFPDMDTDVVGRWRYGNEEVHRVTKQAER